MSDILVLVLRRLRAPLITLIAVYAIAIFGLVLMPGTDPSGQPWRLSVFDAFYVMTYTATTIGFGEVPYPFSYAQRLWMTLSIYLSVVGWAYTLGSVFALTRHPAFKLALRHHRFERSVARMTERFYVVCGYGQSGRRLVAALDRIGYATVVLEQDEQRTRAHLVSDMQHPTALLVADARAPDVLLTAGIRMPNCMGLIALTGDDQVNQAIVIGARALAKDCRLLARVKSEAAQDMLSEFGNVIVVNPFHSFGVNFAMALSKPDTLRLEDWITGVPGAEPPPRFVLPHGHWVIAGYGRFGHAVAQALADAGLTWKAIDIDPAQCSEDGIVGNSVAEEALRRAGIEQACGLIACTDVDASNLAVIIAARRCHKKLFVVVRQNQVGNRALIAAAHADMEFVQAQLMTNEVLQEMTTPLLNRFLMRARNQPNAWAVGLIQRLREVVGDKVPYIWGVRIAPELVGVAHVFGERPEPPFALSHLMADPLQRSARLPVVALMLSRAGNDMLLPDVNLPLAQNDRIVFAGTQMVEQLQRRTLADDVVIDYLRTGHEPPRTWLGRLLMRGDDRA
ncbi:MAG: NAD-binding protein [Burkholderiaceae bacterium]|nr:NAD-binding protein [Rhodoferax sp.]MCB2029662.1 NAD-binding protein [Rhodoferax sp.]MCB2043329.1 NAD-binding protein [Rhodoferax sp.]MCP5262096.1 NAD-binding protein [Rhodoferax sp.]MCW5627613.1 NAD-binding protein [Rhodoferax sp.]